MTTFTLTPAALVQLRSQFAARAERHPDQTNRIRIGVKSGGCMGFEPYVVLVDQNDRSVKMNDHYFQVDEFDVRIDSKSLAILTGATIDWHKSLMRTGWRFTIPTATGGCECGKSFGR